MLPSMTSSLNPQSKKFAKFAQLRLENFLHDKQETKQNNPVKESKLASALIESKSETTLKKRRGRPRKYDNPSKKVSGQALNKERLQIEEILSNEEDENEDNEETKTESRQTTNDKRGTYNTLENKTKLNILDQYIAFKKAPDMVNEKPKPSFNEFFHDIAKEFKKSWSTIKSLCLKYEKTPALYTQLQVLCLTEKKSRKSGQVMQRDPRLSYPKELDFELADYIYASLDLGLVLTPEAIKEEAKKIIKKDSFMASDSWMNGFMNRHNFSFRKLNEKSNAQTSHLEDLRMKFVNCVGETISKFHIKDDMVINMDESPIFWQYLPRKVLAPTSARVASAWKRNYYNSRSTLILSVTAGGQFLRPCLVLKRKTPYYLQRDNDIGLALMNSDNGWSTEDTIVEWLEKVLIPYVQQEHCLLLWDSYESHKSTKVLTFLKAHPNIHPAIIIGGLTSKIQPLDINVNKQFKTICKQESVKHANLLLLMLNESNALLQRDMEVNNKLLKVNDQMIIAEKDLKRAKKKKQTSITDLMAQVRVEDVYSWVRKAYLTVKENKTMLIKGFQVAGYVKDKDDTRMIEELSNMVESMEIEVPKNVANNNEQFVLEDKMQEIEGLFELSDDESDSESENPDLNE